MHDMLIDLHELKSFIQLDTQSRIELLRSTFGEILARVQSEKAERKEEEERDAVLKKQKLDYRRAFGALEQTIQWVLFNHNHNYN